MSAKLKAFILGKGYGIFFTALTVLLGALFLLQTLSVYIDGTEAKDAARTAAIAEAEAAGLGEDEARLAGVAAAESVDIYSRSIAKARLMRLLPYICVWAAALIADVVLTALASRGIKKKPHAPHIADDLRLRRERARLPRTPQAGCEAEFEEVQSLCIAIRDRSRHILCASLTVGAVCLVFPLIYFLDSSHFPAESLSGEVVRGALFALPFLAVLLGVSIACTVVRERLAGDELKALKRAIKAGIAPPPQNGGYASVARLRLTAVRIALFALGVGLVVLGALNGSAREVFIKATKICTECIGLG